MTDVADAPDAIPSEDDDDSGSDSGVDQHEFIQDEIAAEHQRALDAVFKPEFVQALLAGDGIGPLARALGALARMGQLTVFCRNAQPRLHQQADGTISFQTEVTSACPNGNVQLNCEV